MKTYIFDPIHQVALDAANEIGEIVKWDNPEVKEYSDAEAIIVRTTIVDKNRIDSMPKLRIIAKHGIGTDNIDLKYAKEKGIFVTNTPTANMTSVAELAVTLALSCARQIPRSNMLTKNGLEILAPRELTGLELSGKTVGLIGAGRIGQKIGEIFREGLGMNLSCYDPYLSEELADKLGLKKYDKLLDMLRDADVVSISVPLTESTINLIAEKELEAMKETAILVNTARGKIVNEKALYEALLNNRIKYAAMDVFEIEPPKKDNPLLSLDNFIATPHIGAATEEALVNMGLTAVEEIKMVLQGKTPRYIVNQ
ncbi:hydroxyacid dehydrogenase [Gudongella sp. SC589]|jgi:D-3-phosphoglycerate dehydrogenase|uniref:hydroxyacid dehydrogenase n=1 Tax=Gudongella sp. SC589 TaxID=3385990 RepID=UPI003904C129